MRSRVSVAALSALLAAATTLRAEDAVVAEPFEERRAADDCAGYGPGFARLPGTTTCYQVGGALSLEKRIGKTSGGGRIQPDFRTRSD